MQQWFSGFLRPDQRYQGENTEPMNEMIEIDWSPAWLIPSIYHQA